MLDSLLKNPCDYCKEGFVHHFKLYEVVQNVGQRKKFHLVRLAYREFQHEFETVIVNVVKVGQRFHYICGVKFVNVLFIFDDRIGQELDYLLAALVVQLR